MKICPTCRAQLEDTAKYCPSCGTLYDVQAPQKKKKTGLIIGMAAAAIVVAIAASAIILIKPQEQSPNQGQISGNGNTNTQTQEDANNHTPATPTTINGYDIFQGQRFDQMLWGHYEAIGYKYGETSEFLQDMKYIPINESGDLISALPASIYLGQASHFHQYYRGFEYEDKIYYPYTELGKAMYRKAYIEQNGDMTEEEFQRMEQFMNMMVAEVTIAYDNGHTDRTILAYKIEGNILSLYEFSVDDQYNLTQADKPLLQYEFLHDGGTLYLANEGIQRSYRPYGNDPTDSYLDVRGYALNESQQYQDLEGISFWQFDYGEEFEVYPILSGGDRPVNPSFTFDQNTGNFTLSWSQRYTYMNGYLETVDNPTTITGTIISCSNYGFNRYAGFILFVDGTQYLYLMSSEEYYERNFTDLSDNDNLSDSKKEELISTRRNILEELEKAFREAGISATIDYGKGQIALEANFLFDTGSYALSQEGQSYLDAFVDIYSSIVLSEENSTYISRIIVEGHTDTSGSYSLNQTLSQNRADAVAQRCIDRNAKMANIIQAVGCAYDYPVYNNDGTVNMSASRRVTFRFVLADN